MVRIKEKIEDARLHYRPFFAFTYPAGVVLVPWLAVMVWGLGFYWESGAPFSGVSDVMKYSSFAALAVACCMCIVKFIYWDDGNFVTFAADCLMAWLGLKLAALIPFETGPLGRILYVLIATVFLTMCLAYFTDSFFRRLFSDRVKR